MRAGSQLIFEDYHSERSFIDQGIGVKNYPRVNMVATTMSIFHWFSQSLKVKDNPRLLKINLNRTNPIFLAPIGAQGVCLSMPESGCIICELKKKLERELEKELKREVKRETQREFKRDLKKS